jgi:glycosyltransferase involved in cell wall biosynthesis
MRISALLGTRDEAELLGPAVAALLRAGVASVTIIDDRSTDGTAAAIAGLTRDQRVFAQPAPTSFAGLHDFDGPLFGPVLRRDSPDWVVFLDSDEFLLAGDPATLAAELAGHDVLEIARLNAAPGPEGIDPDRLDSDAGLRALPLIAARERLDRATLAADPARRWILHDIVPKLMVRPDAATGFAASAHRIAPRAGQSLRHGRARGCLIAHLPFTDYPRFARKVRNIADVFDRFDAEYPGDRAWHWRHWVALARAGRLREEFDRQVFDAAALAALRAAGGIATATELLAAVDPCGSR